MSRAAPGDWIIRGSWRTPMSDPWTEERRGELIGYRQRHGRLRSHIALARIRARRWILEAEPADDDDLLFTPFITHRPGCDERHGKRTTCNHNRPEAVVPNDVDRLVAFAEAVLDLADEWESARTDSPHPHHGRTLHSIAREHLTGDDQ